MKVLVTGAAGFIGSHTADYLHSKRFKVLALDNFSTGKTENLKEFKGSIELCDIIHSESLEVVFNKFRPDSVIHLAAQSAITTAWDKPEKDMKVNIEGTLNIVNMCKKYDVKKLIFSSTSAVYGKPRASWITRLGSAFLYDDRAYALNEDCQTTPDTPYGVSKLCAENYIRLLFPNHIILRYGNIYGKRQTPIGLNQVVARAINHFEKGEDFKVVGSGEQKRDFVNVQDIAHLNYLCVISDKRGFTFNASSGKSVSVNNVLSHIEDFYGVRGYNWDHTEREDERGSVFIDSYKVYSELGWIPKIGIKDGIRDTIDYQSNKNGGSRHL